VTEHLVTVFAALGEPSRWSILTLLGEADASASALAEQLPISRQAIARHLSVLESAGLVERMPAGRELRYRAVGAELERTARRLEAVGRKWDARLDAIRDIAEGIDAGRAPSTADDSAR